MTDRSEARAGGTTVATVASTVIVERVLDQTPCPDLAAYVVAGGMLGLEAARAVTPDVVVAEITDAGLRGRGGAGFPTGVKWRTILEFTSPQGAAPVIVNAAEGEPGTFKDRAILRANPYRVLEGALVACHVTGATELIFALKATFTTERDRLAGAIGELRDAGWLDGLDVRVELGPSHYLFGEETALLNVLEGGGAFPRVTPPYRRGLADPADAGDDHAAPELATNDPSAGAPPALVNNVETFANVPGILANGAEWYREMGTEESPGTVVCTITGSTERHAVGEVPMGTPLTLVIDEIGGGPQTGARLVGAISGVSNAFIPAELFETPLTYEALAGVGSGLGSAGFIVVDDTDDLYDVAGQISRFLAVESCGQCEPCKRDGLAIAATFDVDGGADTPGDAAVRRDRLATIADGARCALARQHQAVISGMLDVVFEPTVRPVTVRRTADARTRRPLVLPIVDIVDGVASLDERQLEKNPDWTYGGDDSGAWPAARESAVAPSA